eukprot:3284439-Rhodomonas_salina.2
MSCLFRVCVGFWRLSGIYVGSLRGLPRVYAGTTIWDPSLVDLGSLEGISISGISYHVEVGVIVLLELHGRDLGPRHRRGLREL